MSVMDDRLQPSAARACLADGTTRCISHALCKRSKQLQDVLQNCDSASNDRDPQLLNVPASQRTWDLWEHNRPDEAADPSEAMAVCQVPRADLVNGQVKTCRQHLAIAYRLHQLPATRPCETGR